MFASLARAIGNFFDGTLKGVILRSVGLTLFIFVLLFIAFEYALAHLPTIGAPWVNHLIEVVAPLLFILVAVVFGAPVAAIFGAFFLDRIASTVEARAYSQKPAVQAVQASLIGRGARIGVLTLIINLGLLLLDTEIAPPIPEIVGFFANAWLLGREYFELVALRHMSRVAAASLRRRNSGTVFAAGAIISLISSIPVLDLLAPLFGAAFMVHLYRKLEEKGRA